MSTPATPVAPTQTAKAPTTVIQRLFIGLLLAWALVALLPIISIYMLPTVSNEHYSALKDTLAQWGAFGDMFNCLSVLLTAAALCGVVYTAILQRSQIDMQREEMGFAREELEIARNAAKQAAIDREEMNKEAERREKKEQRQKLLDGKIALAGAIAQISTGSWSPGKREEYVNKAEKIMAEVSEMILQDTGVK